MLLDEAHLLTDWAARLKVEWDRASRRGLITRTFKPQ
jgi:hypothetical protein